MSSTAASVGEPLDSAREARTTLRAPAIGWLAFISILLWKPIAHSWAVLSHAAFEGLSLGIFSFLVGLLGFALVWIGFRKDELPATWLGFLGGAFIWIGWFEYSFAAIAKWQNIPPLRDAAGNFVLPGTFVLLEATGVVLLATLIFLGANKDTGCRMFLWFQRNLRLRPGPSTPGYRRQYSRIAAMELVFTNWFCYVWILMMLDTRIAGARHPATAIMCGFIFALVLYLLIFKIPQQRLMAPAIRYAIGTVALAWMLFEMGAIWKWYVEIWIKPFDYPITNTLIVVAFIACIVISTRWGQRGAPADVGTVDGGARAGSARAAALLLLVGIAGVAGSAAQAQSPAPIRFSDESAARGVADVGVNSTGPTFGDFDNDGDLDLFVPVEDLAPGLRDRLFENDGKGVFKDVAAQRGVENPGGMSRGAVFCDFDNDGDLDLLSANMPPGQARERHVPTTLFRNQLIETGTARFEDVTRAAGLMRAGNESDQKIGGIGDTAGGVGCADYDRDGDLDIYWKNADADIDNALFRNEGGWRFLDVTREAGVAIQEKLKESNAQGSPNWVDFDEDGWIDLLVTNERDIKILLRNAGGGRFEDITRSRRPPSGIPFLNPGYAQGACIADFDNDGDMDVYLPLADQANRMIMNRLREKGALSFEDVTLKSGAGDLRGARGCAAADFDNDGWVDLYVNNGGPTNTLINDVITDFPPFVQFYIAWKPDENALLRNNGDGTFSDVTKGSGAEGFGIGSGVGAADINGDGFPDLFVTNRTYYAAARRVSAEPGQNRLFINAANANNWIKVQLVGTRSNRNAYGARITVRAGDLVQHHETQSAHGYNSTNDPLIGFGLGARRAVDEIQVRWPSGAVQTVRKPAIRKTIRIVEDRRLPLPAATVAPAPAPAAVPGAAPASERPSGRP